jgi:hypothetical protein
MNCLDGIVEITAGIPRLIHVGELHP